MGAVLPVLVTGGFDWVDGAAVLTTGVRLTAPNVGPSVPPDGGAKIDPGWSDGGTEGVATDAAGGSWDAGVGVGTVVTSEAGAETGSAGGLVTGVTSVGWVTVAGGGVTSGVRAEGTKGVSVDGTVVSTLAVREEAGPSGVDWVGGVVGS